MIVLFFFLYFIILLLRVMIVVIMVSAILTWLDPQRGNVITRFLWQLSEPVVGPIRSLVPLFAGFDFSPILAILLLLGMVNLIQKV